MLTSFKSEFHFQKHIRSESFGEGDETWQRLCRALGQTGWAEDEGYATNAKRAARRDQLNRDIADIIATETTAHWVETLTQEGVPCGPIYRIDEMFDDPQVQHLGIAQPLDTEPFGRVMAVGQPFNLSRTESSMAASPPTRGQHTRELLEELGIDEAAYNALSDRSVV